MRLFGPERELVILSRILAIEVSVGGMGDPAQLIRPDFFYPMARRLVLGPNPFSLGVDSRL